MAPEFLHSNHIGFSIHLLYSGAYFYPLLVSFHLQITYRKVRNLHSGVDKFAEKYADTTHVLILTLKKQCTVNEAI